MSTLLHNPFNIKTILKKAWHLFRSRIFTLALLIAIVLSPPMLFTLLLPTASQYLPLAVMLSLAIVVLELWFIGCVMHLVAEPAASLLMCFDKGLARLRKMCLFMLLMLLFGFFIGAPLSFALDTHLALLLMPLFLLAGWLFIRLVLTAQVVFFERASVWQCVKRTWVLSDGYGWHLLSLMLVNGLLLIGFDIVTSVLLDTFLSADDMQNTSITLTVALHSVLVFLSQSLALAWMQIVNTFAYQRLKQLKNETAHSPVPSSTVDIIEQPV